MKNFLLITIAITILNYCNYASSEKYKKRNLIEEVTSEVSMFINDQYEF